MSENITRPIIGIENRTPQEVFDIMVARIGASPAPLPNVVGDKPSIASHMESYRVFVAEVAPRLHWKVWAAVGNSGLYEGGFDGWRHGFGMTQLEAAPLPELMDNMRSALRAALSSPMGDSE